MGHSIRLLQITQNLAIATKRTFRYETIILLLLKSLFEQNLVTIPLSSTPAVGTNASPLRRAGGRTKSLVTSIFHDQKLLK